MLNLRDPFIVPQDHLRSLDDAPNEDGHNGYKPNPEIKDGLQHSDRLPQAEILVELTGIEPVASWLQTRRSPS